MLFCLVEMRYEHLMNEMEINDGLLAIFILILCRTFFPGRNVEHSFIV